jgi:hypothetical protein
MEMKVIKVMMMKMKMRRFHDGEDVQASNDPMGDDDQCPSASSLLDPFWGEFSTSSSVSECRISDLSAQGESI